MQASVILTDLSTNLVDKVDIDNIDKKDCFKYVDNEGNHCEMCVYNDGICLYRQGDNHKLELYLRKEGYAKIGTAEGVIKLDAKVVDFSENNDILVMRYIIDEIEREIKIIYRS